ncbi:hypothetical protein BDL97_03G135300 [Sphagnum fallax]|nr:hypothetical protein BDL97_03G135300 [Sphagnum fallax]
MAGVGQTAEGELAAAGTTIAQNIRDGCDEKEPPQLWEMLSDHVVEVILARLSLVQLQSVRKVCKHWEALTSTCEFALLNAHLSRPQPNFVLCGMNYLVPRKSQAFVFASEQGLWRGLPSIVLPPHNMGSLDSSAGLVYAIAGPGEKCLRYKLSTADVAQCDQWLETTLMQYPRRAPVVALVEGGAKPSGDVAHKLIVAGGVPDFEPEHMAVEIYDSETGAWEFCGNLPSSFQGGSSRLWITGAVCNGKFYVSQIHSWLITSFDLSQRTWTDVQWECPQGLMNVNLLSLGGIHLLLAGLCKGPLIESNTGTEFNFKVWKIDPKMQKPVQIGTMPRCLLLLFEENLHELGELKVLMNEMSFYVYKLSPYTGYPVVEGEISSDAQMVKWRVLSGVPAFSGYRFDHMVALCSSVSHIILGA